MGNSLGPQPASMKEKVDAVLDKWRYQGVQGWFKPPDPFSHADHSVLEDLAAVVSNEHSQRKGCRLAR